MLSFLTQVPYWEWPGPMHMGWGGGFWWMFPMLMFVFMIALCVFMMRGLWHPHGAPVSSEASLSAGCGRRTLR